MKNIIMLITLLSSLLLLNNLRAGVNSDYKKEILGTWQITIADGSKILSNLPTQEYKADGNFIQKMGTMTITGKYMIKGNKLSILTGKKTTAYIIQAVNTKNITLKSETNGKITELLKR